jgi:hypothetical protein
MLHTDFEKHMKMGTHFTPTLTLDSIIDIGCVVIFHLSRSFWWR